MKKHILIIEDDKDILEILEEILIDNGYIVTGFTGIDEIKKAVEAFKPDLVLIDYLLKGINGGEMCSQMKRNEQTAHIPVILISAHPRVLLSLGNYNCDEFIEKPFDIHNLVERVKFHLKDHEPQTRNKGYVKGELNKGL